MQKNIFGLDDRELQILLSLIIIAGSKSGDVNAMIASTDMMRLIQSQIDEAKAVADKRATQGPFAVADAA